MNTNINMTAEDFVNEAKKNITEIDVDHAKKVLEKGALVLDVRESNEFEQGHITNAINIPRGVLEFKITQHSEFSDKDALILIYCKTGGRGALASNVLKWMGYTQVLSLQGGIDKWKSESNLIAI